MSRITLVGVGVAAALLLTACSSSKAPTSAPTAPQVTVTSPAAVAATSAPATASAISGKWSGKYSGDFDGTFALSWQQSGTSLTGTIDLSNPPGTLDINGTVSGGTIKFGTVGSLGITYTGSISGNSMSGSYKVKEGNNSGGGSWSATKS